ncbi:membrane-associated Zn-dependent proteases [Klebsormidium nitens]|uniref:Membrane-associated Zn-dependent proteases n=1 Tax=Klebsormidium nitens TaxID=105231 RepID=A0A1Y1IMT3_KLENI|nr:membrane-associated Zn-dependent proteases [Klebsormidium nitens]|eukprot:GAQ90759.1 membrane-associated Zn-dependent proteases [Klebsormidium nitens]
MSQAAPALSARLGSLLPLNISTQCCQASSGVHSPFLTSPATNLKRGAVGARPSLRGRSRAHNGQGNDTPCFLQPQRTDRGFGKLSSSLESVSVKGRRSLRACAERKAVEPRQQREHAEAVESESERLPVDLFSAPELPAEPSSIDPTPVTQLLPKLKALPLWQKTALLGISALPALPAVFAGLNFDGPASVAQALIVLGAIVTFHECGHFLAARLQNIPVSQFVIGFGPTLAEWKGKEVDYKLKALPLGGYVAFPDEDPGTTFAQDDPRLLKNRPLHERALVISAGVIANGILAFAVLFTQVQTVGYTEQHFLPGVVVGQVMENSSALRGGVLRGDVILSIDEQKLEGGSGSTSELVEAIKRRPEKDILLEIERGGEKMGVRVKAERDIDGAGRIGVSLRANDEIERKVVRNTWRAVELASSEWRRLTGIVLDGLRQIFFNFGGTADKLSGPVAIVALGADVARNDVTGLFQFAALININLAIVNLLPLPALDGGYLALLVVEGIRGGKKLPEGLEQRIMASGLLLLLSLGLFLTVKDTLNLDFIKDLLGV